MLNTDPTNEPDWFKVRYIMHTNKINIFISTYKNKYNVGNWFEYGDFGNYVDGTGLYNWHDHKDRMTIEFSAPLDKIIHVKIKLLHKGLIEREHIKEHQFINKLPINTRILLKNYLIKLLEKETVKTSLSKQCYGDSTHYHKYMKLLKLIDINDPDDQHRYCACNIL